MHKIYVAVIIHILSVKWPLGTLKKLINHQQKEADIRHRPTKILDQKFSKKRVYLICGFSLERYPSPYISI